MSMYIVRWTETQVWQSEVEATSKEDALDNIYSDKCQEHAEVIKTIDEYANQEAELKKVVKNG